MRDNGERIYQGLMEREPMEKLETENVQPDERDFPWENNKYKLSDMVETIVKRGEEHA